MSNVTEEVAALVESKLKEASIFSAEIDGDKLTIKLSPLDNSLSDFLQEKCAVVTVKRYRPITIELFPKDYSKGIYTQNVYNYTNAINSLSDDVLVFHDVFDDLYKMVGEIKEENSGKRYA
jgi:hypothetical protein